MFVPDGSSVRIFNIADFRPRESPVFSKGVIGVHDDTRKLEEGEKENDQYRDLNEDEPPPEVYTREESRKRLFEEVEGWVAEGKRGQPQAALPDIERCALAFDGQVLLGVGKRGIIYSWKLTA